MQITCRLVAIAGLAVASVAVAQPTTFVDLGTVNVPTDPHSQEYLETSAIFDYENENFTVKWLKVTFTQPISGNDYVDVFSYTSDPSTPIVMAWYDNLGSLITFDDQDGTQAGGSGLSFGSTAERVPFNNPSSQGQDGTFAAGTYWIALVAGPVGSAATLGDSDWSVTTTASVPVGFGGDGTTYFETGAVAGNTSPVPSPANDDCSNALVVSENAGNTPAWTGSNFGASLDGVSPCYPSPSSGVITAKDIWFSYVPTVTGWVNVSAIAEGDTSNSAVLSLFGNGCGTIATRCSGGGFIDFGTGTRMALQVQQGVPVLFSLSQRGGYWGGTLTLNINALPAPCTLQTPAGAVTEPESCGDAINEGCGTLPIQFGTISPGQTVAGTIFSTVTSGDRDWYEFTLAQAARVTVTSQSQMPAEVALFSPEFQPGICFGPTPILLRNRNILNPCVVQTGNTIVEPGTYRVAITPLYRDGFSCGSGYNNYWISLATQPCDQPVVTVEPVDVVGCVGGNVTLSANFTSIDPINSYQWQYGVNLEGEPPELIYWNDLFDGEFSDVYSLAQVTGAGTPTLTITGVDAEMSEVVAFRLRATSCAGKNTRDALFTLQSPPACAPGCDTIDFNGNAVFPEDQDVIDFFNVLAGGECPTGTCSDIDFNNNGVFPEDQDVIDFFNVLAGGECP
jgi:hypothetical protein